MRVVSCEKAESHLVWYEMSVMPLNSGEIVYMENDRKIRYSHVNDRFREGNLIFLVLHAPLTRDLQIQR